MALPTSIELQIVTPDKMLVREQVDEVEIPGTEGYFGVLPGHTPMLASLAVGEAWYRKGQERTYLVVAYGFCEVLPERVTILSWSAERADEIDPARAEAAMKRAEARLALAKADDIDYERARKIQKFLSQPFFVAEQFTGLPGKYVPIAETVKSFKEIVDGKHDNIPEQAFYMVGTIEEVLAKAEKMAKG